MSAAEAIETHDPARMTELQAIIRYVLAGNSTFTLVSKKTGARFTYRVRGKENVRFVSVLTGSDNEGDYAFLGTIFLDPRSIPAYRYGKKSSKIGLDAPSSRAWSWFYQQTFVVGGMHPFLEFWHSGRCGRCARRLTVPESIASGLGPECAGRS